jgi:F420H(2)-dependent quinone reductase
VSRVTKPALRGSLLGTVLRALNPIVRVLLQSPLHWPLSRWFAILAWTGRRSGRSYSTPVSYVREGSTAWITTGDNWWHNLSGGAPVAMRIGRHWQSGQGVAVTERAESRTEHQRLFREHTWFRLLSGIPAATDGEPQARAIDRALEAGRTLIRVDLGG